MKMGAQSNGTDTLGQFHVGRREAGVPTRRAQQDSPQPGTWGHALPGVEKGSGMPARSPPSSASRGLSVAPVTSDVQGARGRCFH